MQVMIYDWWKLLKEGGWGKFDAELKCGVCGKYWRDWGKYKRMIYNVWMMDDVHGFCLSFLV